MGDHLETPSAAGRNLDFYAVNRQCQIQAPMVKICQTGVCLRLRDVTKTSRKQKVCAVMYRNVSSSLKVFFLI